VLGSDRWIGNALSLLSLGVTLRNRLLRIAPAYWAILAATALVLGAANVRDESGVMGIGRLTDEGFAEATLLVHDYRPSNLGIGIGPAWSLAVEVVF